MVEEDADLNDVVEGFQCYLILDSEDSIEDTVGSLDPGKCVILGQL